MDVALLFLLISLASLSPEMFPSALPSIAREFGVAESIAQFTISSNSIGIAISSLIYGVLADVYNKKLILLTGLSIFTIASSIGYITNNLNLIIFLRLFQGVGEGAIIVTGYASFRTRCKGMQFTKKIATLNILLCFISLLAPILGSLIINNSNWYTLFVILAVGGFLSLILFIFYFREPIAVGDNIEFTLKTSLSAYSIVVKNHIFLSYTLITLLSYIWWWINLTNLPFLYIRDMGLDSYLYTFYVAIPMSCYILGTLLNRKLLDKYDPHYLMIWGFGLTLFSGTLLLIMNKLINLTPLLIELICLLSNGGSAFIINNSYILALNNIPKKALAKAGAFEVFIDLLVCSLIIYIFSFFYNGTITPIAWVMILTSILSFIVFCRIKIMFKKNISNY